MNLPDTPPSPDLMFYYILAALFGFGFLGILIWVVNRFVTQTQKSIDVLTNSVVKLEAKMMLQEQAEKNREEDVDEVKEQHNRILAEFNSTLARIDTTFRMVVMDYGIGNKKRA